MELKAIRYFYSNALFLFFFLTVSFSVFLPYSVEGDALEQKSFEVIFQKLLSPKEEERFKAVDAAKENIVHMKKSDIEEMLLSLGQKNVSTLIFVLMATDNDVIYRLNKVAQKVIEESAGSFPNIAFYYGRIKPEKGIKRLFNLHSRHPQQALFICKAIGETNLPEAVSFLIEEARRAKSNNGNMFPFLSGLKATDKLINSREISWFLSHELNREEVIILSQLTTEIENAVLLRFYEEGSIKKEYSLNYVFRNPILNFGVLKEIVERELHLQNYNRVLTLMMSDNFRNIQNEEIQRYRRSIISLIRVQKGE